MEGLARAAGVGSAITLGGRKLKVSARILRHYAEIEEEVRRLRGNPFNLIREAKEALRDDPELMKQFVERAFDEARRAKIVTPNDVQEYLSDTWSGGCFALWLALRENDPQAVTLQWVSQNFCDEFESRLKRDGQEAAAKWREEIDHAINSAGGEDEVGNSTGSPSSGSAAEAESANRSTGT